MKNIEARLVIAAESDVVSKLLAWVPLASAHLPSEFVGTDKGQQKKVKVKKSPAAPCGSSHQFVGLLHTEKAKTSPSWWKYFNIKDGLRQKIQQTLN